MRRRLTSVLVVCALACVLAPRALAQVPVGGRGAAPPPPNPGGGAPANPNIAPTTTGTAAISGVVLDDETRRPVPGAIVYLGPPQRGPAGEPVRQITDEKGRFLFTQLPAWDNYFLQAIKFGYFQGNFGRAGSGATGARLRVVDGQWLRDLEITMRRYGSIAGVISDENGDPIVNAYVRVLMSVPVTGRPQLASGPIATTDDRGRYRITGLLPGRYIVQVPNVQSSITTSVPLRTLAGLGPVNPNIPEPAGPLVPKDPLIDIDDQVLFVAGRYPIPPRRSDGRPAVYPITFHPSSPTFTGAVPIDLAAGENRMAVDVRVTSTVASRISGVLDGPPESYAGITARLLPQGFEWLGDGAEAATALVGDQGQFSFVNVPAGVYTIDARRVFGGYQNSRVIGAARSLPGLPAQANAGMGTFGVFSAPEGTTYAYRFNNGDNQYTGQLAITVDGRDQTGIHVPMRRGINVSGFIDWDGPRVDSGLTTSLTLVPARGDASLGVARATFDPSLPDEFFFSGLARGEYLLYGLTGRLKSFVCKDKDYTYTPIDTTTSGDLSGCVVTLTNKSTTVSGTVRDERASPLTVIDAAVIVFPVEREQWTAYTFSPARLKSLNTTPAGTYRFTSLPEGDYYFIAVAGDRMAAWQDPAFLERAAAQATRVSIKWGDTTTQDLALKVVK